MPNTNPTREQLIVNINAMESQGASPDEIQGYLDQYKGQQAPPSPSSNLTHKQSGDALAAANSPYQQEAAQFQKESDQANSPLGIAKETGKGVADTLIGGAAKFVKSALYSPVDIVRGFMGKAPLSDNAPIQTIQSDAVGKTSDVYDQKKSPLRATAETVGTTLGGAADVLTAGEAGSKLLGAGEKMVNPLIEKSIDSNLTKTTVKALTPKLTPSEIKDAVASGKGTLSRFGTSNIDWTKDKGFMNVVEDIKGLVKGKSAVEDVNSVIKALASEADSLKTAVKGVNQPVSIKGVNTWLDSVEKPLTIKSDATLDKQFDLVKSSINDILENKFATKGSLGVSDLLDTRKEFDQLVDKEFPTLYDKENAPMRNAITSLREALNKAVESNLPDNVAFRKSLSKQTNFYRAIDNLVTKVPGELGVNKLSKLVQKYPKTAGAVGLAALEGIYSEGKKLIGQ